MGRALLWMGVLALLLLNFGCGAIQGEITTPGSTVAKVHDFERTEIIHNGSAIADGNSELLVIVQLKDSDNQPVAQYKPTYDVIAGQAVIGNPCTTSLETGISVCVLKSTLAGAKTFRLTNAKTGLEHVVTFEPILTSKGLLALLPAGTGRATTTTGYKGKISCVSGCHII